MSLSFFLFLDENWSIVRGLCGVRVRNDLFYEGNVNYAEKVRN